MDNSISGSVVTYAAGERLTTRGNDVDEIYIILKGRIKCMTTYGTYYLGPGSAAGLTDCYYGMYVFNYFADEDTMVKRYTVSSSTDITRVLNDQADNISIFAIMHSRHIADIIKTYLELTMKCRDVDAEYRPDSRISRWELDKFNALSSISNKTAVEFYKASLPVTIGSIYDGVRFLSTINDACSQMADRLEINVDYVEPEPEDDFIMAIEDTPAALTDTGDDFDEAIVRFMRLKMPNASPSLWKATEYRNSRHHPQTKQGSSAARFPSCITRYIILYFARRSTVLPHPLLYPCF